MDLVLRRRKAARTCAVCRDDDGALDACRGCGATTHAECGAEGCPTIGCSFQREPRLGRAARPADILDPHALRWPTRGDEHNPATRRPAVVEGFGYLAELVVLFVTVVVTSGLVLWLCCRLPPT